MSALLPNLGGEEGEVWRSLLEQPAVAALAELWALLFSPGAQLVGRARGDGAPAAPIQAGWPEALGAPPDAAVYDWLAADGDRVVAWIQTREAEADPALAGRPLAGPSAEVVARVHDKAFAHEVATRERLLPACLRDLICVLDPEELADAAACRRRVQSLVARWPSWTEGRFALKPRIGTSGRGRVGGAAGDPGWDWGAVERALPRLAERGGAMLEPWLERSLDLSVQLHVADQGAITLLGSLVQCLSASGVYRGHRGEIDSRGRVSSGAEVDEAMRSAAAAVALAAAAEGFRGPCGVDGFAFRGPPDDAGARTSVLRPASELNARFTAGTVALGLVRRALPLAKERTGLRPGERRAFYFGLDAPGRAGDSAWTAAAGRAGEAACLIPLWREGATVTPALLFARDADDIDRAVSAEQ